MGKINVLDKHVAELIAAGEVVERPSSVIKELIENCIDAKATSITVEIKNGGKTYMRVSDNGSGIYKEDVPKAFLRNATSKIKQQDDLDSISTLGFRGEALASICAVARVELITCVKGETTGTKYEVHAGEEIFFDDYGCAYGTTIIVRDLFYNVPGRMKFLKKDVSEGNSIAGVIDRIAMSCPEISFGFIRDGKNVLTTPGNGDLYSCIYSVYGKEFANTLIPVKYELNDVKVKGFISTPLKARPTRSMQHFFINGRYVKTRTAMAALEEAFKNSIMVGKFPACVMFIEVPTDTVDVNVHPAKIEVRFMNERPVFDAIYHAVKTAIAKGDKVPVMSFKDVIDEKEINENIVPPKNEDDDKLVKTSFTKIDFKNEILDNNSKSNTVSYDDELKDDPEVFIPPKVKIEVKDNFSMAPFKACEKESLTLKAPEPTKLESFKPAKLKEDDYEQEKIFSQDKVERVIGEAFKTYIIVEKNSDELLIIDKHAAHERMIFEKLKSQNRKSYAQVLMIPEIVTLDKDDYDVILSNENLLEEAGFDVENFGVSTIKVRTSPIFLSIEDIETSILEIASYLRQNKKDITTSKVDWIYHNIACRAALKAGTPLKNEEMVNFYLNLSKDKDIRYCPHGRPVSIVIKKKDLEKQFKRIV